MPRITPLLTYDDAIDLLADFAVGRSLAAKTPTLARAVEGAYDELATAHRWNFLRRGGRVIVNARQTTGSAAYDHTGGASERLCTLTTGTNPSWIDDAAVRLGTDSIVCDVEEGTEGGSTFTLSAMLNPGQDVDDGDYVLYQRYVRLPSDFRCFSAPMAQGGWRLGSRVSLDEFLALDRYDASSSGQILQYAIAEVPDLHDALALFVYPQPSATETIDFPYTRYPRVLRYTGHQAPAGTIAVTADSAAVVGTSTAFASDMVGAVLRIGTGTDRPTGRYGEHPFAEERIITAVTDTTNLTLDAVVVTSREGVSYSITDPIDIGRVAKNAFLRMAEKHLVLARPSRDSKGGIQNDQMISMEADRTLLQAMGADNPVSYDPLADRSFDGLPYAIGDDD